MYLMIIVMLFQWEISICTVYADDVILISQSESGLQNCLKKLKKKLSALMFDINIDKMKSIVFNKSGKLLPYLFHINGNCIEAVET